jgi:SAM-dependent methyltransferase
MLRRSIVVSRLSRVTPRPSAGSPAHAARLLESLAKLSVESVRRWYATWREGPYGRDFVLSQQADARRSAEAVVPLVMELATPSSVIDVGCGTGIWLATFARHGVLEIVGVDSEQVPPDLIEVPPSAFVVSDLTLPLQIGRKFDLVVCLEVAEHLPQESADQLIASLTDLGDLVLFSAAIPRQGGIYHVNEQWPEYWQDRFAARGYVPIDCVRRKIWSNPEVAWWYAQNMLIYARRSALNARPSLRTELEFMGTDQLSIVHPHCYDRWRRRAREILELRG